MFILMIILILLGSSGVTSQEILSSASDIEIGECSCLKYKDELIKAEKDMDNLKSECTREYYTFSQTLVEKPKLWTKSNFCTKKSLQTVAIRLRYLADLTRKIKEHCKAYEIQAAAKCPNGWLKHDDSCYLFVTERKTWSKASEHCERLGSDLVIVESESENKFLTTTVQNIHGIKKQNVFYFMGGTDSANQGNWVWSKTGQPITYNNWCPGEPNNKYNGYEYQDCLSLRGFCEFKWDDTRCSVRENFICEKYAG